MTQWAGRGGEGSGRQRRGGGGGGGFQRLRRSVSAGGAGRPHAAHGGCFAPRGAGQRMLCPRGPPVGSGGGCSAPLLPPWWGWTRGGSTLFASPRGWSHPPVGLGRWGFATRCPPGGAGRGMLCPAVPRGRGCLSPGLLCLPPRYPVEGVSESGGVLSSPLSLGLSLTWGYVILTPELGCRGDLLSPDITPRPGNRAKGLLLPPPLAPEQGAELGRCAAPSLLGVQAGGAKGWAYPHPGGCMVWGGSDSCNPGVGRVVP